MATVSQHVTSGDLSVTNKAATQLPIWRESVANRAAVSHQLGGLKTPEAGSLDTILDVSSTTYCRYTCLVFIRFFEQLSLANFLSFRRRESCWRVLWTSRQASLFLVVFSPICKRWSLHHFSLPFLALHSNSEGVVSRRNFFKKPTDSLVHWL